MRISDTSFAITLFIGISLMIGGSCANHNLDEMYTCTNPSMSYADDVRPIVMQKCAIDGCHNGALGADRNWTDFNAFKAHSATVKDVVFNRVMPPAHSPAGPLTNEQVTTIVCWVDQGAPNN